MRLSNDEHVKLGRSLHLRTNISSEPAIDHFLTLSHLFSISFAAKTSAGGSTTCTHLFARGTVFAPLLKQDFRGLLYLDAGAESIVPLSFAYKVRSLLLSPPPPRFYSLYSTLLPLLRVRASLLAQVIGRVQLVHIAGKAVANLWPAVFAGNYSL
jgi:hypothetical protein